VLKKKELVMIKRL